MCNFNSSFCRLCDNRKKDEIVHVLFECENLKNIRETAWNRVLESMPINMVTECQRATAREKTILLLSCYGGSFIPEWTNIYVRTINFVDVIYKERAIQYKAIEDENALS